MLDLTTQLFKECEIIKFYKFNNINQNQKRMVALKMWKAVLILLYLQHGYSISQSAKPDFNGAFSAAYDQGLWNKFGGPKSGPGSDPCITFPYLTYLQHLISNPLVHKIVEIGFGDWEIMQHLILDGKNYVGYEVVKSIIRKSEYNTEYRWISQLSEIEESGDLLLVRDVMMHWPSSEIDYFIQSILPRFKFALLTNDYTLYEYQDIKAGDYRAINLQKISSISKVIELGNKYIQLIVNDKFQII